MKTVISNILKSISIKVLFFLIIVISILYTANYSYINIKKFNDEKNELIFLDSISKTKIWDTSFGRKGSGVDTVFLKTKYLDGKLYYRIWFDLNKKDGISKFDNIDNFVLYFNDNDNFTLLEITLEKSKAIKIIDSFENFIAFRFEGTKPIDKKVYTQLKNYSLTSTD